MTFKVPFPCLTVSKRKQCIFRQHEKSSTSLGLSAMCFHIKTWPLPHCYNFSQPSNFSKQAEVHVSIWKIALEMYMILSQKCTLIFKSLQPLYILPHLTVQTEWVRRLERKCIQPTLLLWVQMIKGWLGGPFRMMQVKLRVEPLLKNTSGGPEISVWGSRIWEMTMNIIYLTVFCRCFEYTLLRKKFGKEILF